MQISNSGEILSHTGVASRSVVQVSALLQKKITAGYRHSMNTQYTCEKTVLYKVWWKILPFVFVLFMINMLDRVNIGYTALEMNAALGIDPTTFGLISGIFFIGYFIFEIPSNQALSRVGARLWLGWIMVS